MSKDGGVTNTSFCTNFCSTNPKRKKRDIQINPGAMKTRKKKKKQKVRKIRIIVLLLLTTNAERMHNIPSTHFDLQLHL